MKTIGFLGGMTYHSTTIYYSLINSHVQRQLGGCASASIIMHSLNHGDISALFAAGRWEEVADKFVAAAEHMRAGGAQALAIGCNAGHKVAEEVASRSGLPLLHTADFTAEEIRRRGLAKVALLGTRTAMEGDFIKGRLREGAKVEVLVPGEEDCVAIDRAIMEEIGAGIFSDSTKAKMREIVERMVGLGAQAVVLACTDLQFVLKQEDVTIPLLDTMELHAKGIADWALAD